MDSRCDEQVVVPAAKIRQLRARGRRVVHRRVAKIAKRANLAVARGGVFLAKTFEIFPRFRLQPSHLLRQALLVLRTNLRVPAHHLLLQRVARGAKRAHLLAKTILLLLVFALALLRGVHLAGEIRLVLREELHLMFARREFARGGVALAAKALLRTLRRRQFLLRLGRAASETIHRRRDLVVHRALGGEHLDLHHGILQLARQSLASRLEGGALRLGLLVRLRDVLEGALGLAGQALVVELEAAELVARAVALDAGDVELGAEVGRFLMHAEHGELLQGELGGILGLELAEALLRADDAAELLLAVGDRLAKGRSEALELGVLVLEELDRLEHLRALLGELALLRGERLLRERILALVLLQQRGDALLELGRARHHLGLETRGVHATGGLLRAAARASLVHVRLGRHLAHARLPSS